MWNEGGVARGISGRHCSPSSKPPQLDQAVSLYELAPAFLEQARAQGRLPEPLGARATIPGTYGGARMPTETFGSPRCFPGAYRGIQIHTGPFGGPRDHSCNMRKRTDAHGTLCEPTGALLEHTRAYETGPCELLKLPDGWWALDGMMGITT